MAATTVSPFMELPAELRLRIYDMVLIKKDFGINVRRCTNFYAVSCGPGWKMPAVLQVSRQIRSEALATYYANNIFASNSREGEGPCLEPVLPWLRAIGQTARDLVQTVRLGDSFHGARDVMSSTYAKDTRKALQGYHDRLANAGCSMKAGVLYVHAEVSTPLCPLPEELCVDYFWTNDPEKDIDDARRDMGIGSLESA